MAKRTYPQIVKKRKPRKGDGVAVLGRNGTFVVSCVSTNLHTVDLKMIAHALALGTIPWDALTFLDELHKLPRRFWKRA